MTTPQMKNPPPIFEVVQVEVDPQGKTPLFLEIPVPEKTFPYLVGNPKKDSTILRWVEAPSTRGSVLTWGLSCPLSEVVKAMVEMTIERDKSEKWDVAHIQIAQARTRMESLGITETRQVGNLLVPQDPSLLGTILVLKGLLFPVIHNPSRGFCLLHAESAQHG